MCFLHVRVYIHDVWGGDKGQLWVSFEMRLLIGWGVSPVRIDQLSRAPEKSSLLCFPNAGLQVMTFLHGLHVYMGLGDQMLYQLSHPKSCNFYFN